MNETERSTCSMCVPDIKSGNGGNGAKCTVFFEKILADLGDESAYAKATSMSGIITVETSLDPENAINDVRALIDDEPWVVRYLMRLIPITKWIESKQDQIVSNVLKMSKEILPENTSYRITIEKRNSGVNDLCHAYVSHGFNINPF